MSVQKIKIVLYVYVTLHGKTYTNDLRYTG